jgi:hypothetical protein
MVAAHLVQGTSIILDCYYKNTASTLFPRLSSTGKLKKIPY